MNFVVRTTEETDIEAIAILIREFAEFEKTFRVVRSN